MSNFPENNHSFQEDEKGEAGRTLPPSPLSSQEGRLTPGEAQSPLRHPSEKKAMFPDTIHIGKNQSQPADPAESAELLPPETDLLSTLTKPDVFRIGSSDVSLDERVAALERASLLEPSRLQALLAALKSALHHSHYGVRVAALKALGELDRHRHLRQFIDALQDDAWQVRAAAVRELSRLGQEAPRPLLVAALDDPDVTVRDAAIWALKPLAVWAWEAFEDEQPLKALRAAFEDTSELIRAAAVEAIADFPDYFPLNELISLSKDDVSELVRASATLTLGRLREEQAGNALLLALFNDESELVRAAAAEALGYLHEEQPVETLLRAFHHDTSELVRAAVLKSLGTLGEMMPAEVLNTLLQARKDLSEEVRAQARASLDELSQKIYGQASLPFLFSLLQNESDDIRQLALWALGLHQDYQAREQPEAVPPDARAIERKIAIWALEQLAKQTDKDDQATPLEATAPEARRAKGLFLALVNLMKEKKGSVQVETRGDGTLVLKCFYQQESLSLQEALLNQTCEAVYVPPLEHALHENDDVVRELARQALHKRTRGHWTETFLVSLDLTGLQRQQGTEDIPARILVCSIASHRVQANALSLSCSLEQYIKEHRQRPLSERACAWLEKCKEPIFLYARGISAIKIWYTATGSSAH